MKEHLLRFIENNKLMFEKGNKNTGLTIYCGYCLYKGVSQEEALEVLSPYIEEYSEVRTEFIRIWEYADYNEYGNWWKEEINRLEYVLE